MKVATAKRGLFEIRDAWLTRPLDNDHIEVLRGVLAEGGELPALCVVVLESGAFAVVDGNHRFAAYAAEKRAVIPYRIVGKGEAEIDFWLGAANRDHGKNRTHDEKRAAIARTINSPQGGDMSNVDLARHCGVGIDLVRKVREELRGAASAAAERRERARAAASEASERGAAAEAGTSRHAVRKARRVVETQVAHDSTAVDEAPSRPQEEWPDDEPKPFEALAEACDKIAAAVVAIKRSCSAELRVVPGAQEIVDHLTRAHGIATRRRPHGCPNPACAASCPVCGGRGWTEGEVKGWQGVVAAAVRRAHA